MTAPDLRVCAWCGRTIPDGSVGVQRLPLPKVYEAGDWFCDWTCEVHAADPCMTTLNRHPRKAQL